MRWVSWVQRSSVALGCTLSSVNSLISCTSSSLNSLTSWDAMLHRGRGFNLDIHQPQRAFSCSLRKEVYFFPRQTHISGAYCRHKDPTTLPICARTTRWIHVVRGVQVACIERPY